MHSTALSVNKSAVVVVHTTSVWELRGLCFKCDTRAWHIFPGFSHCCHMNAMVLVDWLWSSGNGFGCFCSYSCNSSHVTTMICGSRSNSFVVTPFCDRNGLEFCVIIYPLFHLVPFTFLETFFHFRFNVLTVALMIFVSYLCAILNILYTLYQLAHQLHKMLKY